MLGPVTIAIALVAVLVMGGCSSDKPAKPSAFAAPAEKLVDDLAAFRYASVRSHFDPDVAAHLSNTDLGNNWRQFEEQLGNYTGRGVAKTTKVDNKVGITFITVPTTMENGKGEVRVAYRTNGTIAGLYFTKAGAKAG